MRNGFLLAVFAVAASIRSGYASHEVSEENPPGQETSSNQPPLEPCLEENSTSSAPSSDDNVLILKRFPMESDFSYPQFPYSQIKHSSEFSELKNPSNDALQETVPLELVHLGKETSSDAVDRPTPRRP